MAITYLQTFLASLAASVVLTRFALEYAPFSTYLGNFFAVYSISFSSLAVYDVILWPKVFSPLRSLPQVEVIAPRLLYWKKQSLK
jgi:hypothetical protein